jgi:hypothetical protein
MALMNKRVGSQMAAARGRTAATAAIAPRRARCVVVVAASAPQQQQQQQPMLARLQAGALAALASALVAVAPPAAMADLNRYEAEAVRRC